MGIYGFTEWFLNKFKKINQPILRNSKIKTDHLLIDFNQFLHMGFISSDSKKLWPNLFNKLDSIIKVTEPTKSVHIILDGPGMFK